VYRACSVQRERCVLIDQHVGMITNANCSGDRDAPNKEDRAVMGGADGKNDRT